LLRVAKSRAAQAITLFVTTIALLSILLGCSEAGSDTPATVVAKNALPIAIGPIDMGKPPVTKADPMASHVAVVMNTNSPASVAIAKYYAEARGVPDSHIIAVKTSTGDDIDPNEFKSGILAPVMSAVHGLKSIYYLVTTKGIPLRVSDSRNSVDALLAGMDVNVEPMVQMSREGVARITSPYFRKDEPFSHAKFGLYLTTRLDGYDIADIKALIDRSVQAKPEKGLFFCDQRAEDRVGINDQLETAMEQIAKTLSARGFQALSEGTTAFVAPEQSLMGYWSSGSNDRGFTMQKYHAIRFLPGSLAETDVSTSARSFNREPGGQSMIADLIHQGVSGVKGYVDEPYSTACAKPDILFDRYTKGYNLAESFYMASQLTKWKDVVVGDPLCRPYAKDVH
jgi:uncharacterized protein (TIGR03790 family)